MVLNAIYGRIPKYPVVLCRVKVVPASGRDEEANGETSCAAYLQKPAACRAATRSLVCQNKAAKRHRLP